MKSEPREYYARRLPHWTPKETPVFVTWRLHGPLPLSVTAPLIGGTGKKFAGFDRAIERVGPMLLSNDRAAACVAGALEYGAEILELYQLHEWVVMPNHVHVLWTPRGPQEQILGRIKSFTAHECNRMLGRTGQFWNRESFDHWVRSEYQMERIRKYTANNPVKAGLCRCPSDWRWSSAYRE
jgi:putative transposase